MGNHRNKKTSSGNPGINGLVWAMLLATITVAVIFSSAIQYGKLRGLPTPTGTDLVSILMSVTPTKNTVTAISTSTVSATSSSTHVAIPTFTFTFPPSFTPTLTTTATTNPMVFRGLDQACLSRSLWTPYFYDGESEKVDRSNCWDLTEWGFIPQNNGLSIVVKDSDLGQDITRRFYTKIKGDTEIIFTVRIDQMTTKLNFDGILMMGVGNSSNVLNSGYYLKYTVVENEKKVYRETGTGLKIYNNPRSEYTLGESQNIIIRITGTQAKIIVDGIVIHSTILSPDEHSVFWIVYSLPSNNGSLIAEISDFQIYDHR